MRWFISPMISANGRFGATVTAVLAREARESFVKSEASLGCCGACAAPSRP